MSLLGSRKIFDVSEQAQPQARHLLGFRSIFSLFAASFERSWKRKYCYGLLIAMLPAMIIFSHSFHQHGKLGRFARFRNRLLGRVVALPHEMIHGFDLIPLGDVLYRHGSVYYPLIAPVIAGLSTSTLAGVWYSSRYLGMSHWFGGIAFKFKETVTQFSAIPHRLKWYKSHSITTSLLYELCKHWLA